MRELTAGDLDRPIVAVGWNSERFDGRNLALRLVVLATGRSFGTAVGARPGRSAGCLRASSMCSSGSLIDRQARRPSPAKDPFTFSGDLNCHVATGGAIRITWNCIGMGAGSHIAKPFASV